MCNPLSLLWRHRSLLLLTTYNDLRARHAGSLLGLSWLLIYPLIFLSVYALIYVFIFRVRFALMTSNEYVALIFCGLIPFLGFAEALSNGVNSVTSNANLIKNTLFPIELIPVKSVLVSQCTQLVGTGMLLLTLEIFGKITVWALLLPLIWLFQLLMTLGIVWIISSLNVHLRDLQNIIGVVILMLMTLSPIAYTADMVPPGLRHVLAINPLYYLIISYQDCLMLGRFPREGVFWVLAALGVILFCVGYGFFVRMKKVFIDNV